MRSRPDATLRASLALLGLSLVAATARPAVGPWSSNEHSAVRLITPYEVAPRRGEIRLGVHFTMIPGWHVYWKNSGDAGFPPEIDFAATPEVRSAELLWPAPERYQLPGDLVAFGYSDEVVYPIRARLEATGDALQLEAEIDYLVCQIDCIPYRYDLQLEQRLGDSAAEDPDAATLLETWWRSLPRPAGDLPGVTTRAEWVAEGPRLAVELEAEALDPARLDLFFEAHELFEIDAPAVSATADGARFLVPLTRRDRSRELPRSIPFAWTITGLPLAVGAVALESEQEVVRGQDESSRASAAEEPGFSTPLQVAAALALVAAAVGMLRRATVAAGAAGFVALALVVGLLYRLSLALDPASLAGIELGLLAFSLFETLRRAAPRGVMLTIASIACALATLALAIGG